jgi:hypothetical protein
VLAGALGVGAAAGFAVAVVLGWGGPPSSAAAESPVRGPSEAGAVESLRAPTRARADRESSRAPSAQTGDDTPEPEVYLLRIDRDSREIILRIRLEPDAMDDSQPEPMLPAEPARDDGRAAGR